VSVDVHQWDAQVAHRTEGRKVGIVRVELDDALGQVNEFAILDDGFAGCPGDIVLVLVLALVLVIDPERECPQPSLERESLRHPGALGSECAREVAHQLVEEALAGLCGRTLDDGSKDARIDTRVRLSHGHSTSPTPRESIREVFARPRWWGSIA
jgi:hypothetical protein